MLTIAGGIVLAVLFLLALPFILSATLSLLLIGGIVLLVACIMGVAWPTMWAVSFSLSSLLPLLGAILLAIFAYAVVCGPGRRQQERESEEELALKALPLFAKKQGVEPTPENLIRLRPAYDEFVRVVRVLQRERLDNQPVVRKATPIYKDWARQYLASYAKHADNRAKFVRPLDPDAVAAKRERQAQGAVAEFVGYYPSRFFR